MAPIWFATREDVKSALDPASAARDDAQYDRALNYATRQIVCLCHRTFRPTFGTRYFDWPSEQTPRSWRLWLDANDLISVTAIVSGGVSIPIEDVDLEPANAGPPFTYIETRLDRQSAFSSGDTHQRAIAITGWWGHSDEQEPAGALVGAIDGTATTVQVSDSSAVGVGHLIAVGAERMTVTGKRLVSTGQTLQSQLGKMPNEVLAQVDDGTAFFPGELLTVGGEQMKIQDIADNTLIVKRAQYGSILDSHAGGGTIYAPRRLTVARADAGTTAGPAVDGTALTRWAPPGEVNALAVAEAVNMPLQEQSGYSRTVRSQAGTGTRSVAAAVAELEALRERVYNSVGRKARTRAV